MTGSILQVSISPGGVPKHADPKRHPHTRWDSKATATRIRRFTAVRNKRVLLITAEGIEELAALGFPLIYGSLGENLTTRGIARRDWRSGPALAHRRRKS